MNVYLLIMILAFAVLWTSMIENIYAISPYQSGYKHGVQDGLDGRKHSDGCHWYILQPGKGFAFHTPEFNRGYVDGFCSVDPHGGSDADEATFSCP
jgi:hypothetical protein